MLIAWAVNRRIWNLKDLLLEASENFKYVLTFCRNSLKESDLKTQFHTIYVFKASYEYELLQKLKGVDIGILKIHLTTNDRWLTIIRGFARIGSNEIIMLVNDAEKASDINPQEAQQKIVEASLRKALSKRQQTIEANLALKRAKTK